ncbi:MAG: ArnT family glycosyltransferase [Bryobacteraceae bacterium]
MRQHRERFAVFTFTLILLIWGAGAPGFATSYVDPIGKIPAQDEAVYASTTFDMASHGGWMTPKFLGRYVFYKPPLFYWLAAPCVKIFGNRAIAMRLPSILASAATVALVFYWLRATMPFSGAAAGALLLLSSHIFFILSRAGMMDALLALEIAIAIHALARDPHLKSCGALLEFGCASGAAVMTKSAAGLFPLLALGLLCLFPKHRPGWARLAQTAGITAAIALPWHLWQLYEHPHWFWSEYVLTELLGKGRGAVVQTTRESQAGYYLKRLIVLDPVLFLAARWRFTIAIHRI